MERIQSMSLKGLKLAVAAVFAACAMLAASAVQASVAQADVTVTKTSSSYTQVIPVKLNKGGFKLTVTAGTNSASAGVYTTSNSTSGQEAFAWAGSAYSTDVEYGSVAKSTTYYLRISSNGTGARVTINEYGMSKTLVNGRNVLSSSAGDGNSVSYYKINVPSRGYITLNLKNMESTNISAYTQVYNSKLKAISGGWDYYYSSKDADGIGVKKGTYYIGVKSSVDVYSVGYTFKKYGKKAGSKKSKATKIKKKKSKKGVITQGGGSQWYKFKVTKNKAPKIYLSGKTYSGGNYGGLRATVYKNGKKIGGTLTLNSTFTSTGGKVTIYGSGSYKGTYQIKISKYNTGSGAYKLKWK